MQPIERYGVITLMLLVVTIFVVAMWKDEGQAGQDMDRQAARVPAAPTEADLRAQRLQQQRDEARRQQQLRDRALQQQAAAQRAQTQSQQGTGALAGAPASASITPATGAPISQPGPTPSAEIGLPGSLAAAGGVTDPGRVTPSASMTDVPAEPASKTRRPGGARGDRYQGKQDVGRRPAPSTQPAAIQSKVAESGSRTGAAKATSGKDEIRVASGDSLSELAEKHLGSHRHWRELAAANGISDPSQLRVGQTLVLPSVVAKAPVSAAATRTAPVSSGSSASGNTYRVASGDILGKIAQERLGRASRWREIVELNPGINPNRLEVGTVLRLPGDAAPAAPVEQRSTRVAGATLTPDSARRRQSKVR